MPFLNDPYYSSSAAHYYVPSTFSVSGRAPFSFSYMSPLSTMLSAGIGSNPVPRSMFSSRNYSPLLPTISETNSPILIRRDYNHRISPRNITKKTYYRPPRPLIINTESIDWSTRQKSTTDENDDSTVPGRIHRGRTVVRMHTKKLKENPGLRKKKTQGELLVEKFLIKEKPDVKEEPTPPRRRVWEVDDASEIPENTISRRGTIKRYTSGVKKKSGPLLDIIDNVPSGDKVLPRKISVSDELLKEEAALLDSMIQEEMGQPIHEENSNAEEVPAKRKKTLELLTVEGIPRKTKTKHELKPYSNKKSSKTLPLDDLDGNKFKKTFSKKKSSETLPVDSIGNENVLKKKSYSRKKSSRTLPLDEVDENANSSVCVENNSDLNVLTRRKKYNRKKSPKPLPLDSIDNTLEEACNSRLSENQKCVVESNSSNILPENVVENKNDTNKIVNIQSSVGEIEKKLYKKVSNESPKFKIDSIQVEETLSPKLAKKLNYEVIIEENIDNEIEKKKRSSENEFEGLKKIKKLSLKSGNKTKLGNKKNISISSSEDSFSSLDETTTTTKFPLKTKVECEEKQTKNNLCSVNEEISNIVKGNGFDSSEEKCNVENISTSILSEELEAENIINSPKEDFKNPELGNTEESKDYNQNSNTLLEESNKEINKNKLFAKKILEKKLDPKFKKRNTGIQVDDTLVKPQRKSNYLSNGNFKALSNARSEIDMATQLHTCTSDLLDLNEPENCMHNLVLKDAPSDVSKDVSYEIDSSENIGKNIDHKFQDQSKMRVCETKVPEDHASQTELLPESKTCVLELKEQEVNLGVSEKEINVGDTLETLSGLKIENKDRSIENNKMKSSKVKHDNLVEKESVSSELKSSGLIKGKSDIKSVPVSIDNESSESSGEMKIRNEITSSTQKTAELLITEDKALNKNQCNSRKIKKQFSVDDFNIKKINNIDEQLEQINTSDVSKVILDPLASEKNCSEETIAIKNIETNDNVTTKAEEVAIKNNKHLNDISPSQTERNKVLPPFLRSENKDTLCSEIKKPIDSPIKLKEVNYSDPPKKEAAKPKKVNELIKAFSSDGCKPCTKHNSSERNNKDKNISSKQDTELKKAFSLDEKTNYSQSINSKTQVLEEKKIIVNSDPEFELSKKICDKTKSTDIPENTMKTSRRKISSKTKDLAKVFSTDNSLSDISKENKANKEDLSKTNVKPVAIDKPDLSKPAENESVSFGKTSKLNISLKIKKTEITESINLNVNSIRIDEKVTPKPDITASHSGQKEVTETNESDTSQKPGKETNLEEKLETGSEDATNKEICKSVAPPNLSVCSVSNSSTEETSSDEETSEEEESDEESSDEEPSGKVSFSDDSADEVGSTESKERGSPTRRYSNAALSLDSLSDSQDGRGFRSGRVTPPATTIPRYRKYAIEDFQFLKVLGKGSFGKVLLAELRGTQYYYAVKCLKKDVVLEDDDVECTLIERKVLALGTKHPYLCHLFCTFQTESHLFFVMEYLNGGDLMFHIQNEGRFDEGRARFYAAEIVSGLKFLHNKGIVYRDLKLDNILLDFDGHVRIADFGMCKLQIYLDRMADTFCGTPDYMAPEIIKGLKYNQGVDWWSFGVLLYEMLVGQSPFSGCDEDDLFWCICNKQPQYPRYITIEGKTMLRQLLEKDSSKRLGSSENGAMDVIEHPFFNGLDWARLERRELRPPFKPDVSHPLDVQYFDKAFTAERARLTPVEKSILQSMDQTQFQGFTYTNPNCTE